MITLGVCTIIGFVLMALAAFYNARGERKTRNCCAVFLTDVLISVGAILYFLGDNTLPFLRLEEILRVVAPSV